MTPLADVRCPGLATLSRRCARSEPDEARSSAMLHQALVAGLSNSQRLEHIPARDFGRWPSRSHGFYEIVGLLATVRQHIDDRGQDQITTCGVPRPIHQNMSSCGIVEYVLAGVNRRQPLTSRLQHVPGFLVWL
jgi:hypothetical protein